MLEEEAIEETKCFDNKSVGNNSRNKKEKKMEDTW
jgi:hypothetical protein